MKESRMTFRYVDDVGEMNGDALPNDDRFVGMEVETQDSEQRGDSDVDADGHSIIRARPDHPDAFGFEEQSDEQNRLPY